MRTFPGECVNPKLNSAQTNLNNCANQVMINQDLRPPACDNTHYPNGTHVNPFDRTRHGTGSIVPPP
jgi:hypothetical protein